MMRSELFAGTAMQEDLEFWAEPVGEGWSLKLKL